MLIYSFEPIIDNKCKILILGTMPGVMSLKKQQYYGYDQNAFWRIMYELFGQRPNEDYDTKKRFLLERHIAVWDVLKACEREGSSDSDIKNPEPNDFTALYAQNPDIRHVCFNGGPAERLYNRFIEKINTCGNKRNFHSLPSTSPANTVGFKRKLEDWRLILKLLEQAG